uniref:Uncharacterized protein n=1 Tax=Oryza punctata TaxID=4537 RepID=A0A0E0JN45_ORYPU
MWMELKRDEGVDAVAARRRGLDGGSAEFDMHSLARESITTGEGLSFRLATATPVGVVFPLGRCCVFYPLPMGSSVENHVLIL